MKLCSLVLVVILYFNSEVFAAAPLEIASPPQEGESVTFNVTPEKDGSVTVTYIRNSGQKSKKLTKHFGDSVLLELLKVWNGSDFSIINWKSDFPCVATQTWYVKSGKKKVQLCENKKHLERVHQLQLALQMLFT